MEAVKIDGFSKADAAKAADILQQLESAGRKESVLLHDELRGLYNDNGTAMKSFNARARS